MSGPFDSNDAIRMFDEAMRQRRAARDTTPAQRTPEQARADRRLCDTEGHRYQVAGRLSPSQVRCSRCRCTWAIGPKTEPAS